MQVIYPTDLMVLHKFFSSGIANINKTSCSQIFILHVIQIHEHLFKFGIMHTFMLFQGIRVFQFISTHITFKVPLICMHRQVLKHVLLAWKSFRTILAAIAVVSLVHQKMALQIGCSRALPIADRAIERHLQE